MATEHVDGVHGLVEDGEGVESSLQGSVVGRDSEGLSVMDLWNKSKNQIAFGWKNCVG